MLFFWNCFSRFTQPLTKTAAWMSSLVAKIEYVIIISNWTHEIMAGRKKKLRYSEKTPWFPEYYIGWMGIVNCSHETKRHVNCIHTCERGKLHTHKGSDVWSCCSRGCTHDAVAARMMLWLHTSSSSSCSIHTFSFSRCSTYSTMWCLCWCRVGAARCTYWQHGMW